MNIQLQEALASILTRAASGMEEGIQFLSEQLPDVVNQLLLWKLLENLLPPLIAFIILVLAVMYVFRLANSYAKDPHTLAVKNEKNARSHWYSAQGEGIAEARRKYKLAEAETISHPNNETVYSVLVGVSLFVMLASLLVFLCELNLTWLKILVAPKIFLIEYAASLVK